MPVLFVCNYLLFGNKALKCAAKVERSGSAKSKETITYSNYIKMDEAGPVTTSEVPTTFLRRV